MGLKKTINHKGIDLEYHRIIRLKFNAIENETHMTLAIYKDRAAKLDNQLNYLEDKRYRVSGIKDIIKAYQHLKELIGAEDVLEE